MYFLVEIDVVGVGNGGGNGGINDDGIYSVMGNVVIKLCGFCVFRIKV